MTEVVALRPKAYAYLDDGGSEHKKAKGTKKRLLFENLEDCLFNNKTIYRSQERFKSYNHDVYAGEVNKTALSSNDHKSLQTSDKVTTYPYGKNAFKVCESEIMIVRDLFVKKYDEIVLKR